MKKNTVYIVVVVTMIFLFLVSMSPIFNITSINVKGNELIPNNDILSEIDLVIFNKNIFLYPANKYEKQLKENSYFSDVKIKKNLPNEIEVIISERSIDYYTLYSNNSYLYMDNDGIVLDNQNSFTKNCPIIKGLVFETWTKGEKLEVKNPDSLISAITIAKTIKRYGEFETPIVINVSDPDNINIVINNVNVVFGDISNCDIKVRRAVAAIPEVDAELKGYLYVNDVSKSAYFKIIT